MMIKLDCPRCKHALSVPGKLAGSYGLCPRCNGRFWVPKDGISPPALLEGDAEAEGVRRPDNSPAGAAAAAPSAMSSSAPPRAIISVPARAVPGRAAGAAPAIAPAAAVTAPPAAAGTAVSVSPAGPGAPPHPPSKTARLIALRPAQSSLASAPDGRLPWLHIEDGQRKDKSESKTTAIHPALLMGILATSIVLSVFLAMTDSGTSTTAGAREKAAARRLIEEKYFGGGSLDQSELEPYQHALREAQRAHSRHDFKTERNQYRRVLVLLRARKGDEHERGLTGSRERDKKLEETISILLRER